MSAYWIFPCFYGICHGIQPMVEEDILPADHEFRADRFDNSELRQLEKALRAVLLRDRAALTIATYMHAYKSWRLWTDRHDAALLSADPVVFTLYIVYTIQQTWSVSLVSSAVYCVSWVRRKSGYQEPNEYPVVNQVVELLGEFFFDRLSGRSHCLLLWCGK